jgi:hypothetical protein
VAAFIGPTATSSNGQYQERIINNTSAHDLLVATHGAVYYVDHFGNELGVLDVTTGVRTPLLSELRSPYHAVEVGHRLYFTEFGTADQEFSDGALSVFDLETHVFTRLRENLHAPSAIDADSAGNLFVLEVPGTSTIFGGTDRLLKFDAGQTDFTVLIDSMNDRHPFALLVDKDDDVLYISDFGTSIPGDTGALLQYDMNTAQWSTLLEGLPSIKDMEFDRHGNILVAGLGEYGGTLHAVSYVPASLDAFITIRTGLQGWTVASDAQGSIYFSTGWDETVGRWNPSVRVLSIVPEPGGLALLTLAVPTLLRHKYRRI